VRFALLSVGFCLDFGPFLLLLLCFFRSLFISYFAEGGTCKYKKKLGQCFPCCTRFHTNLEEKKTSAEREGPKKVPERERERERGRTHPSVSNQFVQVSTSIHNRTVPSPLNTQDGSFYIHARAHFAGFPILKTSVCIWEQELIIHPSIQEVLSLVFSLSGHCSLFCPSTNAEELLGMVKKAWLWREVFLL
jgi:hypothetical protein